MLTIRVKLPEVDAVYTIETVKVWSIALAACGYLDCPNLVIEPAKFCCPRHRVMSWKKLHGIDGMRYKNAVR